MTVVAQRLHDPCDVRRPTVRPVLDDALPDAVLLGARQAQGQVGARDQRERRALGEREGEAEAPVVVGVLADQVDPARGRGDQRWHGRQPRGCRRGPLATRGVGGPALDDTHERLRPLVVALPQPHQGDRRRREVRDLTVRPRPCGGTAGRPTSAPGRCPVPAATASIASCSDMGGHASWSTVGRHPDECGRTSCSSTRSARVTWSAAATRCERPATTTGSSSYNLTQCRSSVSTGRRTSAMSTTPRRTTSSWSSSVIGTSVSGPRRWSRQARAHLSGVVPVTNPTRSSSDMGPR